MALGTADLLRARLNDRLQRTSQFLLGDGTATAFSLSGYPVLSAAGSATVQLVLAGGALSATSTTAWDYNAGVIALGTALSAGSAALVTYYWSVFSQEEIDTITALAPGDLIGMTIEGLRWLAADLARQKQWAMAQGPSIDPRGAQQAILKLLEYYQQQRGNHADGGLESWSEWQQGGSEGYAILD